MGKGAPNDSCVGCRVQVQVECERGAGMEMGSEAPLGEGAGMRCSSTSGTDAGCRQCQAAGTPYPLPPLSLTHHCANVC